MVRCVAVALLLAISLTPLAAGTVDPAAPVTAQEQSLGDWTTPTSCLAAYCNACAVLAFAACKAQGTSVKDFDCVPTTLPDMEMGCACVFTCNEILGINRFILPGASR